ncbi:hypothetical protein KJ855_01065, partial [Patescibacteria group bacterium]|nr:hypothetical protein [Patescibacteria group bacterium]
GDTTISNGVTLRYNDVDATSYYVHNINSFTAGQCGDVLSGGTIDACENTWGAYPVSDAPAGMMNKNPGNIWYDQHGVRLTSPNGGQTWQPGSVETILWTTYNNGGNSAYYDLYYSLDNTDSWNLITENQAHTGGATIAGSYSWEVPLTATQEGYIRVDIKDSSYNVIASDVNNTSFNIQQGDPQVEVRLSTPLPSTDSIARVFYTNDIDTAVENGSVKIVIDDEFDLTGITNSDVSVQGGNVVWSATRSIDIPNKTVIFPYTGNFDLNDKTVEFTIGGTNKLENPATVGPYNFDISVHPNQDGTGTQAEARDAKVYINAGLNISASIPATLEFDISTVASSENVNGSATNFATTSNNGVNFGVMTGGDNRIGAHDLTLTTNNASGYTVEVRYTGKLSGAVDINDFTGSNATPATWLVPGGNGYFGYTSTDSTLEGGNPDRFTESGGNKWAAFETTYRMCAYNDGPATDETTRIGYRLNLAPTFTDFGVYQTEVIYLVLAAY